MSLAAEARIPEEPGAGNPHAGICAGAVGQLAVLPRCSMWMGFHERCFWAEERVQSRHE